MDKKKEEILEIISNYLDENPEIRFCQSLYNLRILETQLDVPSSTITTIDCHYLPDSILLKKLKEKC